MVLTPVSAFSSISISVMPQVAYLTKAESSASCITISWTDYGLNITIFAQKRPTSSIPVPQPEFDPNVPVLEGADIEGNEEDTEETIIFLSFRL